jgi:hypothetical protein
MTHPKLLEAAKAIDPQAWDEAFFSDLNDGRAVQRRANAVRAARAAVQALLEPDEGMVEAGSAVDGTVTATEVYRAMLLPLLEGEGE